MSRRHAAGSTFAGVSAGPPTLQNPALPMEQLATFQKRLAQLSRSLGELEVEIATEQGLADWPALLSRHTSLLSHIHSLTSSITSPSSHFVASQLAAFEEALLNEALVSNIYVDGANSALATSGDALFSGTGDRQEQAPDMFGSHLDALPAVTYTDKRNALERLAVHPTSKVPEADKAAALGSVLRTRLEPDLIDREEQLVEAYDVLRRPQDGRNTLSNQELPDEKAVRELEQVRDDAAAHDALVLRALRLWHHLSAAPDEAGETYNWKLRLDQTVHSSSTSAEVAAKPVDAVDMDELSAPQAPHRSGKHRLDDVATGMAWTAADAVRLLHTGTT